LRLNITSSNWCVLKEFLVENKLILPDLRKIDIFTKFYQ
jgi:hypothetical protein